ncbi:hypothetical protein PVL29_025474 [Vitis rotundifolia]|uniref:Uncharacterized protein n=1 Tax=Vitis rotundifolia TaxID=103349 RepID=A0AA38YJX1_VITRO|nr:hypothetical protein PVL29_025474 [Vitis rotundifolia]
MLEARNGSGTLMLRTDGPRLRNAEVYARWPSFSDHRFRTEIPTLTDRNEHFRDFRLRILFTC